MVEITQMFLVGIGPMFSRSARFAHAAAARASNVQGEKVAKLSNGLTVVSSDNMGPVTNLVLAFRAGSRYQSSTQQGLIHHVRDAIGTDSKEYPGTSLLWHAGAIGGQLTSFATRDVFGVSLTVPRDQTATALSILGQMGAQTAFKAWELESIRDVLKTDSAYRNAYDVVFEDLHRAAYRNGSLANSLYSAKGQIGKFNFKDLEAYASKYLVAGNAVLLGTNVDGEFIRSYGDNLAPLNAGGAASPTASPYKGGEWRREASGSTAHVLLAGQGAAANDVKGRAVQAVLLSALGRSSTVPFTGTSGGSISSVSRDVALSAFQTSYQDGGLAGVYIVGEGAKVGEATRSAATHLKTFKPQNLEAAKRTALNDILRANAHSQSSSIERAVEVLAGVQENAVSNAISQVSANDVEAAAKKLSSKLSIASYGNIASVPYADSL